MGDFVLHAAGEICSAQAAGRFVDPGHGSKIRHQEFHQMEKNGDSTFRIIFRREKQFSTRIGVVERPNLVLLAVEGNGKGNKH